MVKVMIQGEERYMDGWHKENLDQLKKAVELKWDGVLLYIGYEGDGKSTKCAQDMAYLDPAFGLDRVCFTLVQLSELMNTLPPGSAIQYDESWKDTSSSARHGANQRELIRMLTEKRKKRLYIGIVSATFFDLNKYFVIHRTRALINVYANGLERGFFSVFDRDKKKNLYIKGRRDWDLQVETPNYRSKFTNWLPFDSDAYENKKDESTAPLMIGEVVQTDREVKTGVEREVVRAMYAAFRNRWLKAGWQRWFASYMGHSERWIATVRSKLEIQDKDLAFSYRGVVFEPALTPDHLSSNLESGLDLDEEAEGLQ